MVLIVATEIEMSGRDFIMDYEDKRLEREQDAREEGLKQGCLKAKKMVPKSWFQHLKRSAILSKKLCNSLSKTMVMFFQKSNLPNSWLKVSC